VRDASSVDPVDGESLFVTIAGYLRKVR